jgi:hypothetical protein
MFRTLQVLVRLVSGLLTMCWNAPIYTISVQIFTFYCCVGSVRILVVGEDTFVEMIMSE